jgi:hypothetical protein
MFYRILFAPPGYPHNHRFLVAKYRTLEFGSSFGNATSSTGSKFFENVEEARDAIPQPARQLPFEPHAQFIELWETLEPSP